VKTFRDPVHNLIAFGPRDRLIVDLINAREFQRLRRIRQLGLSNIAYPGAEHSRFVHSLGVTHLMRRILDAGLEQSGFGENLEEYREVALAAALLHDVGHGPFSHALEAVTGVRHELFTTAAIRASGTEVHQVLEGFETGMADRVAQVIERRFEPSRAVVKLLSSQLDMDRTDYLLRDAMMTGAGYGSFDVEWLLHVLRLGEVDGDLEVGLDLEKGRSIAEDYIMSRYYMYLHVYFHRTTRAAEVMIEKLLARAKEVEAYLPGFTALNTLLSGGFEADEAGVVTFMELDDGMIWTAMHLWTRDPDPVLSDLSRRLLNRQIFRGVDVADRDEETALRERLLRRAEREGLPGEYYVITDEAKSSAYKDDYVAPDVSVAGREQSNDIAAGALVAGHAVSLSPREPASAGGAGGDAPGQPTERVYLFDAAGRPHELSQVSFLVDAVRHKQLRVRRILCPDEWLDDRK